ncbi:MAG: transporter substrate-binding domain-containing protein, partial [Treponema sp.]|nr:transporter substrate-binding domain-containing protein [Treponema sp.]
LTELQAYNASVPDNKKLNIIITTNATREQSVAALKSGAWDATIGPLTTVDTVNKDWGNVYQIVDPEHPVQHNAAYHVFNKKSSKLKAEWDAVLKKLVEEGVVSQLSIKWFGKDYTKGAPKN